MHKNNKDLIGFTVCKIHCHVVFFSKWLQELCSYPTLFFSQSYLRFWTMALFKINHFKAEYYQGDLFLFWPFLTVLQIIYFIYNCLLVCPCSVFKFLVETSASAEPTVVVWHPSIHHSLHTSQCEWTMHRKPCLEELKLVVLQGTSWP